MAKDIWTVIDERLAAGGAVAVATIATRDGSAPRGAGAKMAADAGGLIAGTLGGGPAEAMALAEAAKTLADGENRLFGVDMAGSAAAGADLICGGRVRIFVQRLEAEDREAVRALLRRRRRGDASLFATPVAGRGRPRALGPKSAPPPLRELAAKRRGGAVLAAVDGAECLVEAVAARTRLILAGGGHVSLATARAASRVDFDVIVQDDRPEFAAPARFPWLPAESLLVVPGFRDCLGERTLGFAVTAGAYVAILTRGHSHDGEVLAQALATPAGYIGMIGSRRKRDAVYADMARRGFGPADLERVHCPIGLSLGAETPEEIALSIVAQMVAVRAGKA